MNPPAKISVKLSDDKETINIRTSAEFNMGPQKSEVSVNETRSLSNSGEALIIKQNSKTPWGKQDITTVYNRIKNETCY